MQNRVCHLFGIRYPIIQGGMVWCSGWRLASAVSNAGGLGLLGAGSMHPETLREHIRKCKAATDKPFGVNVPLMYPEIETLMEIIQEEGVKIVFTSAGNPKTWTSKLQQAGIKVADSGRQKGVQCTSYCRRRNCIGRRHLGRRSVRCRRGTDGYPLCSDGRKFGAFQFQRPLPAIE